MSDKTAPKPPAGYHRHRQSPNVSRRLLLGGVGAGAAGLVAGVAGAPSVAGAVPLPGQTNPNQTRSDRFGRMFPDLPIFAPANNATRAAMRDIGKPGGLLDAADDLARGPVDLIIDPALSANNRDNQFQTAGTTFVGQFLDHDMTFDTTSELGFPTPPEETPNARTPALDLDSVYGGGPTANPALYQPDREHLRIESSGVFEDFPREPDGTAIIGDPRNDENLMIAGIHQAFILAHNRVVDQLRAEGMTTGVFAEARRIITWHWQWIVIHQFLRQVVSFGVVTDILAHGRRFYRPEPGPAFIPVEFQGAVYRFGHSMVRPSYRANLAGNPDGSAFFGMIFDPAGEGQPDPVDLRGFTRAPRRFIGWQTFFQFNDGELKTNKRIDRRISTPLFHLPLQTIPSADPPISLPERNLLRGITWELPSGQAVANAMGWAAFTLPELAPYGLQNSSPLWYYAMAEAELVNDGIHLGPMGGRLVGEVIIGLIQLDPNSYLRQQPTWVPTLPRRQAGTFTMEDLLTFARVDPASRGQ
ncbi:MAG: peroxidase family protein [Natronosporangium sp.]